MERRDLATRLDGSSFNAELLHQYQRLRELATAPKVSGLAAPITEDPALIVSDSCRSVDDSARSNPLCVFCRNNGAPMSVYRGHVVKDNRGLVTCPVLRKLNCPYCRNGGGDRAHTANFCPKKRADFLDSFLTRK